MKSKFSECPDFSCTMEPVTSSFPAASESLRANFQSSAVVQPVRPLWRSFSTVRVQSGKSRCHSGKARCHTYGCGWLLCLFQYFVSVWRNTGKYITVNCPNPSLCKFCFYNTQSWESCSPLLLYVTCGPHESISIMDNQNENRKKTETRALVYLFLGAAQLSRS